MTNGFIVHNIVKNISVHLSYLRGLAMDSTLEGPAANSFLEGPGEGKAVVNRELGR